MKKQILAVAAALVFTALAPAQSHAQQVTQAKVPFAFQAGNTMMPAGEYQIQRALPEVKTVAADSARGFVCRDVRTYQRRGIQGQEYRLQTDLSLLQQ